MAESGFLPPSFDFYEINPGVSDIIAAMELLIFSSKFLVCLTDGFGNGNISPQDPVFSTNIYNFFLGKLLFTLKTRP